MIQPLEMKETHPIKIHAEAMLQERPELVLDETAFWTAAPIQTNQARHGPHHSPGRARRTTMKSKTSSTYLNCNTKGARR